MRELPRARELAPNERALLEQLLDSGPIGEEALREQLETVRVTAETHGDSRSIRLRVGRDVPRSESSPRIAAEGMASDDDGVQIDVLLHVVDGCMDELEVYRVDGEQIQTGEIRVLFNVLSNPE
jgi:hypothetical protein